MCRFVMILAAVIVLCLCPAAANAAAENEMYNKAFEYKVNNDYQKAIETIQGLLSSYPQTRNEDVYQVLSEIYDSNLHDYEKAIDTYMKYLNRFPDGRFSESFKKRLDYLEGNRKDWASIKEYEYLQSTYPNRNTGENIKLISDMLEKYPGTILRRDIYKWLASEYMLVKQPGSALVYIEKYFSNTSEGKQSVSDETSAYSLYADILAALHRYGEAVKTLKDVSVGNPDRVLQYKEKIDNILKEQRTWYGMLVSVGYVFLVLVLLLILRPWRDRKVIKGLKSLPLRILYIGAATIIPMMSVMSFGYGFYKAFPALTLSSSLALVMSRLLTPVSARAGRAVYIIMCLLLTAAAIYIPLYLFDNLAIFWSPIEF